MSGDHHDLLRMFAALQIGDHVVACTVGQLLWSEREMHTGSALNRQISDELSIFGSHCCCWNASRKAEAGVGQPIVRIAHGSHQSRDRAQVGRCLRPGTAVSDCLTICGKCQASCSLALVIDLIEQHDFSAHTLAAQGLELVEVVDYD